MIGAQTHKFCATNDFHSEKFISNAWIDYAFDLIQCLHGVKIGTRINTGIETYVLDDTNVYYILFDLKHPDIE